MINCRLIALSIFLIWGCGEEATDSEPAEEEKKVVTDDPASSSASGDPSPEKTVATSPANDDPTPPPKGCSSDGRLCLIVSLDNDDGFQVKAVIKEENKIASNAQGNVIFSLTRIHNGEIDGFYDADGEYEELPPEDSSATRIPIPVTNGEAVLYDTEISFDDFSTNFDPKFVLKAQYGNTPVELKACQSPEEVTFDC